jgi:hypothetical protein
MSLELRIRGGRRHGLVKTPTCERAELAVSDA